MVLQHENWTEMLLQWEDGRIASMTCTGKETPFYTHLLTEEGTESIQVDSDFFAAFMDELIVFFETGEIPVSHEETIAIIAVREAGLKAIENPGQWIEV